MQGEFNGFFSVSLFLEGCRLKKDLVTENLWEERIVLVEAGSSEEACAKAAAWAGRQEFEYQSISGDLIEWKFRFVGEACEIIAEAMVDGAEIFSRFLRRSVVDGLREPFDE